MVSFKQATDADEPGTNNSLIIYEIVQLSESHMESNISINSTTGEIHLASPVDYEHLNNKSGMIKLIVQARDFGTPAQSSNATVTIQVRVRLRKNCYKFYNTRFIVRFEK